MNTRRLAVTLLAVLALQIHPLFAGAAQTGKQTVQDLYMLFSAWTSGRKDIFDDAATKIDYATMSEMCFTPAQWDRFAPSQKKEFVKVFRSLIEERYYKRWHKMFLHSKMTVLSEGKVAGDWYVKTSLADSGEDDADDTDTVIWRLRNSKISGEPMVVSLNVNGKDLLSRLQPRFRKAVDKRGPVGIIAWLKDKADIDDEPEFASSSSRQSAGR